MKALHFTILLFLSFFAICCGGSGSSRNSNIDSSLVLKSPMNDTFQRGKIISHVVCKADPTQSYALYIPKGSSNKPLPVVYFFDPHGDGLLPVKKYQSLADSFHFILAGSNNSKNGNDFNDAQNIFEAMKDDVQKRIAFNPDRIYTCGFSGGAKVATFLALHHPEIKGVIANGAGLEEITTEVNFKFSFTAIAGKGDMNMTDLVSIDKILDNTQAKHRIIFFDGIHEWAPKNTMKTAFSGFQFDATRNNLIPRDSSFINQFVTENKTEITDEEKANQFLKAESICQYSINMLDGVTNKVDWFRKTKDSIINTIAYKKQSRENESLLQKEETIKSVYQQQFQNGDEKYWNQTIADVKSKSKGKSPEAAMYQRLQAYLSLAFYSISNQMINRNQNKEAEYFVSLYKTADPTNSEAWYFSAILNARNNNAVKAKDDLLKAISLGFNDKKRLEQQPEFNSSKVNINLDEIERKMK
jgi:predicted esterase